MESSPFLIAAGNIVLDLVYTLPAGDFSRRGLAGRKFSHVPHDELDTITAGLEPSERLIGGSALNKARIAAALGTEAMIVGAAADDGGGELHAAGALHAAGDRIDFSMVVKRPRIAVGAHFIDDTGRWAVVMAPGSFTDFDAIDPVEAVRKHVVSTIERGAEYSRPAEEESAAEFPSIVDPTAIVTVEAFLVNNRRWLAELVSAAATEKLPVHLDLGAPPLITRNREFLLGEIVSQAAYMSGTEEEFAALLPGVSREGYVEALDVQWVVVKRGPAGAEYRDREGRFVTVPGSGEAVTPPWSVGCGDVLDGVFLAARLHGLPAEDALTMAVESAVESRLYAGGVVSPESITKMRRGMVACRVTNGGA